MLCCWRCLQEMDKVWGKGDHVQIVHPGSACIAGRELVRCAVSMHMTLCRLGPWQRIR